MSELQLQNFRPDLRLLLDYHALSQTAVLFPELLPANKVKYGCAIVSAGSADLKVAYECQRTLNFLGVDAAVFADLGAAGIWRFMERLEDLSQYRIIVVVTGMEGALATIAGGLLSQPIVAVPTSIGYGVASGGHAALNSMLSSCASGITVVNIDNGYGAACAVFRYLQLIK